MPSLKAWFAPYTRFAAIALIGASLAAAAAVPTMSNRIPVAIIATKTATENQRLRFPAAEPET